MNAFKERCITLRKQDYTLNEIVKITGRPKTSVHFHIQHIQLSQDKQRAISEANRKRILEISINRKGVSARKFRKFTGWNECRVSLISHLLFDGEIKHGGCVYNNRNLALIGMVQKQMSQVYDFEPKPYFNNITGVNRISYFNVALSAYFKEKSINLIEHVVSMPINLKREFLKAFFDDEGCMDFRPKRNLRRVRGYQKDNRILYIVQKLLLDFKILSKIQKPNEIVIGGKENLERFRKQINFSQGVRINGNRSNSIWKKSLEKRVLLDQAIKSFKH